ncbi:MAG: ParA family protein [Betaproteobacteria bacterium AqS2]|uniref:ParA family protein n=1 Tax=Candidatus Amphirhobacter heronislandensis TaxID=1732024 RepID=A0A930UJ30_9GAMM|nr:ParA family protein [Betaproteobacteria bacterium AqS2]
MKTVAVANRKGGTGKTTTAVNLAACLAARGRSVLLIDADPQANATVSVGLPLAADGTGTAALLAADADLAAAAAPTPFPRLAAVPAGPALAAAEFGFEERGDGWQRVLRDKLTQARHDHVIIDTPPAMGFLAYNCLAAADGLLVPLQCDYFSLEGLREFAANLARIRQAHNPGLRLAGLLRTMHDPRTLLARQVSEGLRRQFGSLLFETSIPRNVRLAEAPSHGKPVIHFDRGCSGARAYEALADEFERKCR